MNSGTSEILDSLRYRRMDYIHAESTQNEGMSPMTLTDLDEVELQFRVERVLARYAQCIDDDQLEAWPELFIDWRRASP